MRRILDVLPCLALLLGGCAFDSATTPAGSGTGKDAGAGVADAPGGGGKNDAHPGGGSVDAAPGEAPDADVDHPRPDAGQDPVPGPHHHLVTSSMRIGSSAIEAGTYAFDLDGNFLPDNALGVALASVGAQIGADVDAAIATALTSGNQVFLHSISAQNLENAGDATWFLYRGLPQASPDLTSGNGEFTVDPAARRDSAVSGTINNGRFTGSQGLIVVDLYIQEGMPPLTLELIGARVNVAVGAKSCDGRMGGAITATYMNNVVVPAIAAVVDNQIAADGDCRNNDDACSSTSKLILAFFDTDGDRFISADELRSSVLVKSLLGPDVDMLDAEGNPGHDQVKDSLSIAFGLRCAGARFTVPWEE